MLTCEISRQGSLPTWAPVKPYTEFALILRASCRPSSTCFLKGSVSFLSSVLALWTDSGITSYSIWKIVTPVQTVTGIYFNQCKPLSGREQVFQDLWEKSFSYRTLHKEITCRSLDEVLWCKTGDAQ